MTRMLNYYHAVTMCSFLSRMIILIIRHLVYTCAPKSLKVGNIQFVFSIKHFLVVMFLLLPTWMWIFKNFKLLIIVTSMLKGLMSIFKHKEQKIKTSE